MSIDLSPPPDSPSRVQSVKKLEDGGLEVTLYSKESFVLTKEDEEFQVFVVWSMLA